MRVLFVIPRVPGRFAGPDSPHTGIGYLTAMLLKHGVEVFIRDMRLDNDRSGISSTIRAMRPEVVGVTSTSYGYKNAYEIISMIRSQEGRKNPPRTVLGGAHVSAVGSRALEESGADFAVKGEGEFTLLELVEAIDRGKKDFSEIQGLIWRRNGQTVENEDRPFIADLNALPFPAYEKFDLQRYFCHRDRILPLITSRGCPARCIYCSVKLSMGRRFRPRSPGNIVDELAHWAGQGWDTFDFLDDNFSCSMERTEEICDHIIRRNPNIRWRLNNGVRADRLSLSLLKKMKQAGCILIAFGIESGNQEILRNICKGTSLERIRQAVRMAQEVGIDRKIGYFIIGHPGETFSTFMDSVSLAKSLPLDEVNFYNLVPYPNTALYKWVKENGRLRYPEEVYLNHISYWENNPIFETDAFPMPERKRAYKIGHSLERRTMARTRFGHFFGDVAWCLTSIPFLEKLAIWFFKQNRLGRSMLSRLKGIRS